MDAVTGFFQWPFVTILAYLRFTVGTTLAILPTFLRRINQKKKPLTKYDNLFDHLKQFPLGKYVFSGIVAFYAPYTSSISPYVEHLDQVSCHASMEDRPWLRNPFQSIHAVALSNLGEFASGMVMVTALQYATSVRGIVTKIDTEYYKKARGTITARGVAVDLSDVTDQCDRQAIATLFDKSNNIVAKCTVTWKLSLREKKK